MKMPNLRRFTLLLLLVSVRGGECGDYVIPGLRKPIMIANFVIEQVLIEYQ